MQWKLFPVNIKHVGLGRTATMQFSFLGCTQQVLNSVDVSYSKHTICSFALQVTFIACMDNKIKFKVTIKMLHPVVKAALQELYSQWLT